MIDRPTLYRTALDDRPRFVVQRFVVRTHRFDRTDTVQARRRPGHARASSEVDAQVVAGQHYVRQRGARCLQRRGHEVTLLGIQEHNAQRPSLPGRDQVREQVGRHPVSGM